jgi:hypothetical protein
MVLQIFFRETLDRLCSRKREQQKVNYGIIRHGKLSGHPSMVDLEVQLGLERKHICGEPTNKKRTE